MTKRDFHGEVFYLWALQDLESMLQFRNEVSKHRPTPEELLQLQINKPWISYYKVIL